MRAEKTKAEDWKLNLKERKSANKTLRERVPPVGASAETTVDESARGGAHTLVVHRAGDGGGCVGS